MAFLFEHGASLDRLHYGTDTRVAELLTGAALGVFIWGRGIDFSSNARRMLVGPGLLAFALVLWSYANVALTDDVLWRGGFLLFSLAACTLILAVLGGQRFPRVSPFTRSDRRDRRASRTGCTCITGRSSCGSPRSGRAECGRCSRSAAITFALAILSFFSLATCRAWRRRPAAARRLHRYRRLRRRHRRDDDHRQPIGERSARDPGRRHDIRRAVPRGERPRPRPPGGPRTSRRSRRRADRGDGQDGPGGEGHRCSTVRVLGRARRIRARPNVCELAAFVAGAREAARSGCCAPVRRRLGRPRTREAHRSRPTSAGPGRGQDPRPRSRHADGTRRPRHLVHVGNRFLRRSPEIVEPVQPGDGTAASGTQRPRGGRRRAASRPRDGQSGGIRVPRSASVLVDDASLHRPRDRRRPSSGDGRRRFAGAVTRIRPRSVDGEAPTSRRLEPRAQWLRRRRRRREANVRLGDHRARALSRGGPAPGRSSSKPSIPTSSSCSAA